MRNMRKAAARWGLVVLTGGALALGACGGDGGGSQQPVSDADVGETTDDVGKDAGADLVEGDEGPQPDVDEEVGEPDAVEDASEEIMEPDVDAGGDEGGGEDVEDDGVDVPTEPCGGPCDEGFACVDDVCIPECGDDAEALRAALSPEWRILDAHCQTTLGSLAYRVLPFGRVLELVATEDESSTRLTLNEWNLGTGPNEVTVLAEHVVPGKMSAWEVFPGYYVATDPDGTVAFFGYTLADFSGAIVRVDLSTSPAPTSTFSAPGNYDVAVLDASTILVNGIGAVDNDAGQGVYRVQWTDGVASATQVVTGLGFASGGLAVDGDLMIAGGFADPWPDCDNPGQDSDIAGGKVFAMSLSTVLEGAGVEAPMDAWCATSELAVPGDFRLGFNGQLLAKDLWADPPVYLTGFAVGVTDDGYGITGTEPLSLDATYKDARRVSGTTQMLLTTENAFIVVAPVLDPAP